MDLMKLLRTLRREWLVAVIVFAVVVEMSVLLAGPTRELHRSSSTLFLQPATTGTGSVSVQAVQFLMPALEARVSSTTMDAEVRRTLRGEVASASWTTSATTDPGTGLLRLEVVSPDPAVPPPVAEAYSTALRAYATESEIPITISVLDPPSAAVPQASRRLLSLVLSGAVLGLGAALGAAMLAARVRRPRRLADQIRERYGIPVLGEIPKAGRNVDLAPHAVYENDDQRMVEAFMRLRTSVEIQISAGRLSSLSVVSHGLGEGKTTITAHLGWTLATLGHRVLLVDGDLRHAWLDVLMRPDLRPVRDPAALPIRLPVQATALPKLSYLSAAAMRALVIERTGSRTAHPAEVVANGMPIVEDAARDAQALVVVDSPPVMGAAEGRYLVSVVDAVVVVVDARRALALEDLEVTLQQVRETGATVLGVVLNRAKLSRVRRREEERYYIDRSEWTAVYDEQDPGQHAVGDRPRLVASAPDRVPEPPALAPVPAGAPEHVQTEADVGERDEPAPPAQDVEQPEPAAPDGLRSDPAPSAAVPLGPVQRLPGSPAQPDPVPALESDPLTGPLPEADTSGVGPLRSLPLEPPAMVPPPPPTGSAVVDPDPVPLGDPAQPVTPTDRAQQQDDPDQDAPEHGEAAQQELPPAGPYSPFGVPVRSSTTPFGPADPAWSSEPDPDDRPQEPPAVPPAQETAGAPAQDPTVPADDAVQQDDLGWVPHRLHRPQRPPAPPATGWPLLR